MVKKSEEQPKRIKGKATSVPKGSKRVKTQAMINNPGGRPSPFDDAAPKIIQFIRSGNTYECASGCARISYHTFNEWMKQGKADIEASTETKYAKFYHDVKKAEMDCEAEIVGHWLNCIPGNWQAGKEYLSRKNPEKWGNREKVDMTQTLEVSQKSILEIPDNGRRSKE